MIAWYWILLIAYVVVEALYVGCPRRWNRIAHFYRDLVMVKVMGEFRVKVLIFVLVTIPFWAPDYIFHSSWYLEYVGGGEEYLNSVSQFDVNDLKEILFGRR